MVRGPERREAARLPGPNRLYGVIRRESEILDVWQQQTVIALRVFSLVVTERSFAGG